MAVDAREDACSTFFLSLFLFSFVIFMRFFFALFVRASRSAAPPCEYARLYVGSGGAQ